jgi:hypothetical protein
MGGELRGTGVCSPAGELRINRTVEVKGANLSFESTHRPYRLGFERILIN